MGIVNNSKELFINYNDSNVIHYQYNLYLFIKNYNKLKWKT